MAADAAPAVEIMEDRPGVLHIINRFDRVSGPDSLLAGLARALARGGHSQSIALIDFGRTEGASTLAALRDVGVDVQAYAWRRGRGGPAAALRLALEIRRRGIGVVHSNDIPSHLVAMLARLFCLAMGVRPRFVASVHGVVDQTGRQRLLNRIGDLLLPRFDAVVIGSPAMRPHLEQVDRDRIHLVWNAIETGPSRPRRKAGRDGSAIRAVCVARLSAEKGHSHVIDAIGLARLGGTPIEIDFIGDGPLRDVLEAQVAGAGLADSIRLRGFVDDVAREIVDADVFVLGSLQESLPMVVLEAMAAGTPIVATTVGAIPDVVGDGIAGLLVPPARPEAMAVAFARLVEEPDLLGRLEDGAAQRFHARHTIERYADDMGRLYRRMVAGED